MNYNRFRQLYHVCVSHEFGGVNIYDVYRKDRAISLARKLNEKACGETISISSVLSDKEIAF